METEFWHLIGRGVEKRDIVLDEEDRVRFMHDLYVFNDANPTLNFILPGRHDSVRPRKLLVDIHIFCLMNNHYHLLVTERVEGGIALFMKKLNMGYAKYFNEKYERSGSLWQGKYRKVQIVRDAHFLYVPFYIHLNPLDYVMPEWRKGEVKDVHGALEELGAYRWSSYLDYTGKHNFPSITRRDILSDIIGSPADHARTIASIIGDADLAEGSAFLEFKN